MLVFYLYFTIIYFFDEHSKYNIQLSLLKYFKQSAKLQLIISVLGIEETIKLVRAIGGTCYGYVCDLCDREDVYKKAKIIEEEIGKVTTSINKTYIKIYI